MNILQPYNNNTLQLISDSLEVGFDKTYLESEFGGFI